MARRAPGAGRRRSPGASGTRNGGSTEADDPRARARQICLNLLTTKARTRAELATALARRGIDEDTANDVLARFSEVGLIDDAAFAESFVHAGHAYRGLGRRALVAQLRRRGVDEQTTGDAVAAVDPRAEEEMARALVRRRLASRPTGGPGLGAINGAIGAIDGAIDGAADQATAGPAGGAGRGDEVATIRRLVGMLARRGYPEGLSYRVVREELRAAGRDADVLDDVDVDATE